MKPTRQSACDKCYLKKEDKTEKMVAAVKGLAARPNGLRVMPGSQKVEGENQFLYVVL